MGKSGTHGIDMLIHWWGRFFGMAQWLQVKWHCMTLSLSMSHTPCVQGFCFQHVRMHLLIWQLRKYLQWSRKPGSNQCSEYTFCHQTIGKTSVCCLNGHHQKAENTCQFGWSNWSNPFRCCLENFRFFSPGVYWQPRRRRHELLADAACRVRRFRPAFRVDVLSRWDADRRLCGGHHSMCTRTTMGRDLKQRQQCTFFSFFFKWATK